MSTPQEPAFVLPEFLDFRGVSKRFGAVRAVEDVSLEVKKGEFFSLLGPSGCGKTTMLRLAAGFEGPHAGRVFLDGRDITGLPPNNRKVNSRSSRATPFFPI